MAHVVAPQAAADLDEAWYYIARELGSIDRADRQIDAITERFHLLTAHPHLGRRRDDDLRQGLRSFAVGNYVIIYRVTAAGDVLILRVLHGRQDVQQVAGSQ